MLITTDIQQPNSCAICGNFLTTSEKYAGQRCLDPSHWQATGLLNSTDFYLLARIAAQPGTELERRLLIQQQKNTIRGKPNEYDPNKATIDDRTR